MIMLDYQSVREEREMVMAESRRIHEITRAGNYEEAERRFNGLLIDSFLDGIGYFLTGIADVFTFGLYYLTKKDTSRKMN